MARTFRATSLHSAGPNVCIFDGKAAHKSKNAKSLKHRDNKNSKTEARKAKAGKKGAAEEGKAQLREMEG